MGFSGLMGELFKLELLCRRPRALLLHAGDLRAGDAAMPLSTGRHELLRPPRGRRLRDRAPIPPFASTPPSRRRPPAAPATFASEMPQLIWLQGGLGCSGLVGDLFELELLRHRSAAVHISVGSSRVLLLDAGDHTQRSSARNSAPILAPKRNCSSSRPVENVQ